MKEHWVIERGPLADPEYLQVGRGWGALEMATRFPDHDSATDVAAETRSEELRVVSDADL